MPTPKSTPTIHRSLAALAVVTGTLMAAYLLLRPYGDADSGQSPAAADAFASPMWIWSHLAGAGALVALAALWATSARGPIRWAAIVGAALVLPYYGAETFGLHAIGVRAQAEPGVLDLVPEVRDHPVAMTLFGIGLVALAIAGIAAALAWRRTARSAPGGQQPSGQRPGGQRPSGQGDDNDDDDNSSPGLLPTALLPLATVAALFLPQFFLPPVGRMTYGLLFAVAAAHAGYAIVTHGARRG